MEGGCGSLAIWLAGSLSFVCVCVCFSCEAQRETNKHSLRLFALLFGVDEASGCRSAAKFCSGGEGKRREAVAGRFFAFRDCCRMRGGCGAFSRQKVADEPRMSPFESNRLGRLPVKHHHLKATKGGSASRTSCLRFKCSKTTMKSRLDFCMPAPSANTTEFRSIFSANPIVSPRSTQLTTLALRVLLKSSNGAAACVRPLLLAGTQPLFICLHLNCEANTHTNPAADRRPPSSCFARFLVFLIETFCIQQKAKRAATTNALRMCAYKLKVKRSTLSASFKLVGKEQLSLHVKSDKQAPDRSAASSLCRPHSLSTLVFLLEPLRKVKGSSVRARAARNNTCWARDEAPAKQAVASEPRYILSDVARGSSSWMLRECDNIRNVLPAKGGMEAPFAIQQPTPANHNECRRRAGKGKLSSSSERLRSERGGGGNRCQPDRKILEMEWNRGSQRFAFLNPIRKPTQK